MKFSIERVLNPDQKARWRWAFADIERVDVVDPLTLRIVTKVPFPTLSRTWPSACRSCLRSTSREGRRLHRDESRGTGPFKFVRWRKDDALVLEANDNVLARVAEDQDADLPAHPRRVHTGGGARDGRDRHRAGRAASLVKQIDDNPRTRVAKVPSALNIHVSSIR